MSITYDFAGRTAIVTGGARGIGRAIATQFARFGAQVWIWDVDPIKLDGAQSLKVDVTSAEQKRVLHVNLMGVFEVTRQVLPLMRRVGWGRIVNMGSLAGKEGLPNLAAYSAASAGVIAFTKALSREVCDADIRVNCVAPGPVDTDLIRRLGAKVVDEMIAASPLKRLGSVVEVAGIVLWLCSEASTFNTGAVFDMSGGRARY